MVVCPECNSSKVHANQDIGDDRFGQGKYACNNCGNTFDSLTEAYDPHNAYWTGHSLKCHLCGDEFIGKNGEDPDYFENYEGEKYGEHAEGHTHADSVDNPIYDDWNKVRESKSKAKESDSEMMDAGMTFAFQYAKDNQDNGDYNTHASVGEGQLNGAISRYLESEYGIPYSEAFHITYSIVNKLQEEGKIRRLGQAEGNWTGVGYTVESVSKKKAKEFKPELTGKKINIISGPHEGKSGTVVGVEIFGDSVYVNIIGEGQDVNIEDGDYVLANEGWKPKIIRASEVLGVEGLEDFSHKNKKVKGNEIDLSYLTDDTSDDEWHDITMGQARRQVEDLVFSALSNDQVFDILREEHGIEKHQMTNHVGGISDQDIRDIMSDNFSKLGIAEVYDKIAKESGLYGYGSVTGRMPPAESWNQQYLGGGIFGTGNQLSDSERELFREFDQLQWSELPADIQELWKSIAEYIPSESGEVEKKEIDYDYDGFYEKTGQQKSEGESRASEMGAYIDLQSSAEDQWREMSERERYDALHDSGNYMNDQQAKDLVEEHNVFAVGLISDRDSLYDTIITDFDLRFDGDESRKANEYDTTDPSTFPNHYYKEPEWDPHARKQGACATCDMLPENRIHYNSSANENWKKVAGDLIKEQNKKGKKKGNEVKVDEDDYMGDYGLDLLKSHDEMSCPLGFCPIHNDYRNPEHKELSVGQLSRESKAKEFNIGTDMTCPICHKEIDVGNTGEDGQGLDYNNVRVAWDGPGTYPQGWKMQDHFEQEHKASDFGLQDHWSVKNNEAWEDWQTGNQLYQAFHDSFPEFNQDDVHLMNMDTTPKAGVTTYNSQGHQRFDDFGNTKCPRCGADELFDKSGHGNWGKDVYCQSCGWEGNVDDTKYGESKAKEYDAYGGLEEDKVDKILAEYKGWIDFRETSKGVLAEWLYHEYGDTDQTLTEEIWLRADKERIWNDYHDENIHQVHNTDLGFSHGLQYDNPYDLISYMENPDYHNVSEQPYNPSDFYSKPEPDIIDQPQWDLPEPVGMASNFDYASEGFQQKLYGYVDAKCKTCGVEFDSIPDMDDHYGANPDHESNINDLDSYIANSD